MIGWIERMAIAGINDELTPWRKVVERLEDAAVRREAEEAEEEEEALFSVAVTRAKRRALITAHGEPSRVLP